MMMQTQSKSTSIPPTTALPYPAQLLDPANLFVVARDQSDLARHLRSSGWLARAGWRSTSPGRQPVWLVRFERPHTQQRQQAFAN